MTADEVTVGQQVRVAWKRFRYTRKATVTAVLPPSLAVVRYRDGSMDTVHVGQLSLRSSVNA